MTAKTARTHVILPADVLEAVERVAGPRGRSAFIAEAVREKLQRENLRAAMKAAAGSLDLKNYPAWQTPEAVSEWVHRLRYHPDELNLSDEAPVQGTK
jgi:metal-responsive CopG/Arc/MetJ family transcriptional regulator